MPDRASEAVLTELRERYDDATEQWADIRAEGQTDLDYVSGNPWTEQDKANRKGQPTMAFDELNQYFNQAINDVRANPRSVKFAPRGNGADEKGAELYRDLMREIEYRSKAQLAYLAAYENAVQRGYGFVRVKTAYASPSSFDQDIVIEAFPNPELVTPDPYAMRPDGLDQQFCFVEEWRSWEQFTREFPEAEVRSFEGWQKEDGPDSWASERRVKLAEYWAIQPKQRDLLAIKGRDGQVWVGYADERPAGLTGTVQQSRTVDYPYVYQYLTNGLELLTPAGGESKTLWPGQHIPIAWCFGKVLYLRGKRVILSMTRLARDPYKAYCYQRCAEVELTAATPKFPYFAYRGSLTDDELLKLRDANRTPQSVILVEPQSDSMPGGAPLPFPQRNPYDAAAIQSLEISAESFRRAIQAAMGISPLPTSAQRRNEKSGKALQQMEAASQKGSFHFVDAYNTMIEAVGVLTEEIMDKVYDTEGREVGIRRPDDTPEMIRINTPDGVSTRGEYLVTVSTGPHYDTERERASDFADTLMSMGPPLTPIVADLAVRLKDLGPHGDQIADRLKALLPPEVRALEQQKQGQMDPAALAEENAALKAQMAQAQQMLQQAMGEAKSGVEKAQIAAQASLQETQMKLAADAQLQVQLQQMKDATSIRVAEIAAGVKADAGQTSAETEALALAVKVQEGERDRVHEMALEEQKHAHAVEQQDRAFEQGVVQGEVQHGQAVDLAERGHRQKLEQGQQGIQGQLAVTKAKPAPQKPQGGK